MQCTLKSLINKIEDKTADSIVNFEKSNPIVFYIKDKNDSIKSWSLTWQQPKWMYRNEIGYYSKRSFFTKVHFYTKKSERNKGYGSAIAKCVRKYYTNQCSGDSFCSTLFPRFKLDGTKI